MNAILTWWGVSMAVASHAVQSSSVVDPNTITTVVPVFVAIMVWVIRILIIGTLSLSMDRLLHPGAEQRTALQNAVAASATARANRAQSHPAQPVNIPASLNSASIPARPGVSPRAAQPSQRPSRYMPPAEEDEFVPETQPMRGRQDPTYHSLGSMSARPSVNNSGSSNENSGANRYRRS